MESKNKEIKLPPIEKIAEAYSVIADGRIEELDEDTFIVTSSNGEKTYKVVSKGTHYRSNDSATKFARYAGYPIIAVLMHKKLIPVPEAFLKDLAGINWNAINKKYKRNYAAALDAALEEKGLSAASIEEIKREMAMGYEKFKALGISV